MHAAEDKVQGRPEAWLDARAAAVQQDLRASLARHPLDPDIAREVADATRKEVEAGWVQGPLSEAQVRELVGPA